MHLVFRQLLFCMFLSCLLALLVGAFTASRQDFSVADAPNSPFTLSAWLAGLLAAFGSLIGYRSDVPWVNTKKGDLWSERSMKRTTDWIARGSNDWDKLGRTLAGMFLIAPLGIIFYGEDSFRNFGLLDAARFGSQ